MRARHVALILCGVLASACSTARSGERPDGTIAGATVLTRAEIERSGARDALEALERSGHHITIQRTGEGNRPRITNRGVGSINLSPEIGVAVDGTIVNDPVGALRQIPASSIVRIQILSGREAMPTFGASGGNGMIVVTTGTDRGG
jgi:outer membrane cobalamin receptor